jgi:predicted nucleotidyltransferase
MKTKQQYMDILLDFQQKRGQVYGISRMGVFGSVARDEQNENSDIDIYYEGLPLSLFKMHALKEELEKILDINVDIVRMRDSMNQLLKKRIKKEGLYVR